MVIVALGSKKAVFEITPKIGRGVLFVIIHFAQPTFKNLLANLRPSPAIAIQFLLSIQTPRHFRRSLRRIQTFSRFNGKIAIPEKKPD
jgi:hypothetical protein